MLATLLRRGNDAYAMDLARKIELRFVFRYANARNQFDGIREEFPERDMSELDCFIEFVGRKLSETGRAAWTRAMERNVKYQELYESVFGKLPANFGSLSLPGMEAAILKRIIEFELKRNKGNDDWTLTDPGLMTVVDDFFLLNEYLTNEDSDRLKSWCKFFGPGLLAGDVQEASAITDDQKREEFLVAKLKPDRFGSSSLRCATHSKRARTSFLRPDA